ncbi:succinate--CoA ligase [GDP-forming] subunit beta, mitochondrial [Carlito syrichta]|uniref:Succinate--CoA ligase [GDP-forming] subunit beta, mitochondrial n=1 Tax=Carlito syrichta TaxID=1868482 RepID=A0A3Q0DIU5_CARSF|nr:succinate--CoA ligase [GDP-forming] subunit beta, mitochondrial [Carlito syrichta]
MVKQKAVKRLLENKWNGRQDIQLGKRDGKSWRLRKAAVTSVIIVVLSSSLGVLLQAAVLVEAILVNIFGGIVNCAIIANGITKACRELELKVPLVVRLEGTNVQEAQNILDNSGLPIMSAVNLEDAAKKAVASVAKK